ncbi:hypothetical protein C8Q79DRAFT_962133 [Trametes meyenii]|nr:hypothetical protein C8Q79DRAFT_962133 [Trametes meyenii]
MLPVLHLYGRVTDAGSPFSARRSSTHCTRVRTHPSRQTGHGNPIDVLQAPPPLRPIAMSSASSSRAP